MGKLEATILARKAEIMKFFLNFVFVESVCCPKVGSRHDDSEEI